LTIGRLLTETYPAATAENVTYSYDAVTSGNFGKGRLTGVVDQSGSMTFLYDGFGRVTRNTRIIGGKTYAVFYRYNTAGRLTGMTYPSGRVTTITRDTVGRVTGMTTRRINTATNETVVSAVSFQPLSNLLKTMTHGNGLTTTAAYDLDYRLTQLQVKNAATLVQGRAYAYADGLNLTGITDQVTAANSNTLSYSPANRLAAASGAWGANSFSYDGVGNRLSDVRTSVNRQSTYPTTSNRLTAMTENGAAFRSYSYDGGGNTVTETRPGETYAMTYNKRNRLVGITRNAAAWATYGYNAFEQMTSRSSSSPAVPTGTVHYIYDLDGHLLAEADAATGAILRDYIWLPSNDNGNDTYTEDVLGDNDNTPVDLPLAVITDVNTATPLTLHVHADHLGRPVRMTNAAKATVWSATWKPWGEAQTITGTTTNNLRFPGQFFQIEKKGDASLLRRKGTLLDCTP
jgi:YD repeat-containing protein